jgi:hypothetical protein
MGGVPAMQNGGLLILPVLQLFPHEPIMLNIVDGLEIDDSPAGNDQIDQKGKPSKDKIDPTGKYNRRNHAQNRIVIPQGLSRFPFIVIDPLPGIPDAPHNEMIHRFALERSRWIDGCGHVAVVSVEMVVGEMSVT